MAKCRECASFFNIPESDLDYEKGKGDCVREKQDQKGKFWQAKSVFEADEACADLRPSRKHLKLA